MEKLASMAVLVLFATCLVTHLVFVAQAQNQTATTTDPAEARALNSIFEQWGIEAQSGVWNISGELCSGRASPNDSATINDQAYNPFIKCDCSYDNGATCHIVSLKAFDRSIVGVLPKELWTLTFLTTLNLAQNSIQGPLSTSVGNLTRMQYLNLGHNTLSGELPRELGKLTDLRMLAIGTNNFSGPLPPEIGDLVRMDLLYIDSCGVSGEIPTTFAKLTNLQQIFASDTELTGRIPDFIGSYSNLSILRLQGNSFDGPIPTSFSNLTSLTDLRISGLLSNGTSALAFINNMKSLSILILSNNNISGSIPSNIGEFVSLTLLDLSFNNLVGSIPDSIFNLTSLSFLFLGNNTLNGTLPERKSSTLLNIDVSYNHLTGSFPSWINNQTLQINLVANNFTVGSSNSSVLPSGLNCLQRNFPCNRGLGKYYNFAIKCGGPAIRSSGGIEYEKEDETLGPATYFVTETDRWAVSNVGYSNPSYTSFSAQQFRNTLDPELFQTSRLSASSLRYYGLGLENGNYTVTLQFAEIAFPDSTSWKSHGRRVFDIYIQGTLALKDFDIRKAAGGVSFFAVQRQFTVHVSENFMEIHLFWAGKGTCCIPDQGTYGPSISAISATANFNPSVSNNPPTTKKSKTGLIAGVVVGLGVVLLLAAFGFFFIVYRRKKLREKEEEELRGIDARPYTFSYAELKAATEDFNFSNKLGEGGFGPVYKGKLNDGRVVAVKQLSAASHQGKSQFVTEIATISAVQHRNLVKLYGCCIEGDKRLLVYEYLENKSLDQALFGKRNLNLDWATRFDICVGVARGLAYLHQESRVRIVHRDVKASNILLDGELIPKISDFGLAKLYDDKKTHISTCVAGTIGYLAPEYAMRGHLTEKADVFAFGVVALELVSGRPNSDTSLEPDKVYLLEWAWHLHENNCAIEMLDSDLLEFNEEEVIRVIGIALLCTQTSPNLRPSMSRALGMLSGDIEVTPVTSRPGYLTDWKFDDISNISMETADTSHFTGTSGWSMVADVENSPTDCSKPMLHGLIEDGR